MPSALVPDSFLSRIFSGFWGPVLLAIALFGINLAIPRDMWVQDEARYAEVLRELMEGGHWLVPYLNGFPYAHKPPLYFWVVALVNFAVGNMELAFRLVSVCSALIAALAVLQLGKTLADRELGTRAAWVFLTAFCTLIVAHIARMDMLLTAAAAFAWLQLLRFMLHGRKRNLVGFWSLTLLSFAVKGPIPLLFTMVPGLVWMYAERGWPGVKSMRPLLAVFALAALVLAWVAVVWANGHEAYLREIWQRQLVGRAVDSWSHKEPFYFYFLLLPLLLMPWLGLVVRGATLLYREQTRFRSSLAAFSLIPLLGLSVLSGKLFIYIEPLLPAFAILAAYGIARTGTADRTSLWVSLPPAGFLALLAGGTIWLWQTQPALRGPALASVAAGLIVLGVLALVLALYRPSTPRWFASWVILCLPASWLVFGVLPFLLNPLFSARPLGEFVARIAAPTAPIGVVNTTPGILNNYAGRTFTELSAQPAARWFSDHPDGVLIVKTPELKAVFGQGGIPASCRVKRSFNIELKEYHVVAGC